MISIEDFKNIDLRIGKILEVENIEKSDKLLKLKVDLGKERRQLVAGIDKSYSPEDLIGREVVVVANLEPKTIFGFESQGMLLAIRTENDEVVLLIPEKELPPGSKVS